LSPSSWPTQYGKDIWSQDGYTMTARQKTKSFVVYSMPTLVEQRLGLINWSRNGTGGMELLRSIICSLWGFCRSPYNRDEDPLVHRVTNLEVRVDSLEREWKPRDLVHLR
jgi:hypothetical protein